MNVINFLRYPGGKRRMLGFLQEHFPTAATLRRRYVEPFLGGGAVFFMLNPERALISDINPDLIDLYRGIQHSPEEVWIRYCAFGSSKSEYRRVRDADPPEFLVDRAARVLFLNRTCFKGMWRHNQEGKFNVGYGGQDRRWVISLDDLVDVARTLRVVEIRCCDFEEAIGDCKSGDFVFADPPYRPGEKELTNNHYVSGRFSFEDHRRLSSVLRDAKRRGVMWALTTSGHPEIVELFADSLVVKTPQGTGRKPGITAVNSGEVLITSYCTRKERVQ